MNEAMKNLLTRRSIRKYRPDMPPREIIDQVIEAGLYAANGMGTQSSIIVCVTDKEIIKKLSAENGRIANVAADGFYGAPVVLIVLSPAGGRNSVLDGAAIIENLLLAAHALGLGACWINRAKEEFEMDEWKEWLRSIGVEGEWTGIGHVVLGYKDCEDPQPAERKPGRVFYA